MVSRIDSAMPAEIILIGSDMVDLRPEILVEIGARVEPRQALVRDRRHGWKCLTSPVAGVVTEIARGARRSLDRVVIAADGAGQQVDIAPPDLPTDATALRAALVDAGHWCGIRARPFGGIADPRAAPAAILVTGFFSDPAAPEIGGILTPDEKTALGEGLGVLSRLGDCGVTLACQDAAPVAASAGLRIVPSGRRGAGHLGTLVRRFGPATPERPVWLLDWQEALTIGRWQLGDAGPPTRLLWAAEATGGPTVIRAILGTPVDMLTVPGCREHDRKWLGPPGAGRAAASVGRFDDRLSGEPPQARRSAPGGPIIPLAQLEAALPALPAPVAFLRALAAGDVAGATGLGAYSLGPEDLTDARRVCLSGHDYPALLSDTLRMAAEDWDAA